MTNSTESFLAKFAAAEPHLPGGQTHWAAAWRRRAVERFRELGLPGRRNEDWKYTNVAALERLAFEPTFERATSLTKQDVANLLPPGIDGFRVVFVNGHFIASLSDVVLPAGVRITSAAEMLRSDPDAIEPWLAGRAQEFRNGFIALNAAYATDGAIIQLAANTVLDRPIWLLFVCGDRERSLTAQYRNIVIAAPGSQATVVEQYQNVEGRTTFNNVVTNINIAANARITHIKVQQESTTSFHFSEIDAALERDGFFHSHSISLGAALARTDIHVALDGEGAECRLDGLYMVDGRQHVDHHTRIHHAQPRGTSHECYKGVLSGHARAVFNGKVVVHEGAQKTDASQTNRNLLLSRNAEVDTKPELEIYADDVKCAHGATVGQLDDDAIFYLRSRGLDEALARNLLTGAFIDDVLARLTIEPLRTHLRRVVANRLPQGVGEGVADGA